jgi:DNA-binding protein H-NS
MNAEIYKDADVKTLLVHRNEIDNRLAVLRKKDFMEAVDHFINAVKSMEMTNQEVLHAVNVALGMKGKKSTHKTASKFKLDGWDKDAIYVNPKNPNESWTGGKKGPKPAWLAQEFSSDMNLDAVKSVFSRLKKN